MAIEVAMERISAVESGKSLDEVYGIGQGFRVNEDYRVLAVAYIEEHNPSSES